MKFLLDANIPYSAKTVFADHEVFHVRDVDLSSATDARIAAWAKIHRAVIVTRDLDFANILVFPPQHYFGLVVLRVPSDYTRDNICAILKDFLLRVSEKDLDRATIIVEEGRIRIRKSR